MQIKESMECAKSELDLFSVPPTNTAIEDGHWDNIQPHPNFDQSPVVRYDITGTNSHYIDLAATELHVKFRIITSRTGTAILAPHEKVALTNNFLHSMFEQCQVYLNNVPVEKQINVMHIDLILKIYYVIIKIQNKIYLEGIFSFMNKQKQRSGLLKGVLIN